MPLPIAQIVVVDGVEHPFKKRAEARAFRALVKAQGVAKEVYIRAVLPPGKETDEPRVVDASASKDVKPSSN